MAAVTPGLLNDESDPSCCLAVSPAGGDQELMGLSRAQPAPLMLIQYRLWFPERKSNQNKRSYHALLIKVKKVHRPVVLWGSDVLHAAPPPLSGL